MNNSKRCRNCCIVLAMCMAIAAGMQSCRSHKATVETTVSTPGWHQRGEGGYPDRFVRIASDDRTWSAMRLPVTLRLESPATFTVSGTATIIRDKSIFLTFRMFGFEVAQVYVTDDQLTLIDRYHKKYVSSDPAALLRGLPVRVSDVQSLILGQPFVAGVKEISLSVAERIAFTVADDGCWMAAPEATDGVEYGFIFDDTDVLKGLVVYAGGDEAAASCTYGAAVGHDSAIFASSATVSIPLSDNRRGVLGEIIWNFDKARWDDDVERRDVSVPAGYQSISVSELLKQFGK